jgi:circadian clock protein KaiC
MASIGMLLRPHVETGTLHLHSLRGRAESPEAQIARIRSFLRETEVQHLVIDPLSAVAQLGSQSTAEGAALQIIDLAKRSGITIVSTSLLGSPQPLSEQTPLGISTIADTWMHVSYLDQGGERNRALTIIKSRGTGHSNQVREIVLTDAGVTLADVYSAGGEMLMGTLRWEKENAERQARATAMRGEELRAQKVELALSDTKSQIERLAREQAIQEAELEQLRASAAAEASQRVSAGDELLQRRRADPTSTGRPKPVPAEEQG